MRYRNLDSKEMLHPLVGDFFTISLDGDIALRVYADSRPHNLKSAQLQKGLILVVKGRELIEEGMGFDVPIAIYSDEIYFSGSAKVLIDEDRGNKIIVKRFLIDTVSERTWIKRNLQNPMYKSVSKFLENFYRNHPPFQKPFFSLIKLMRKAGVKSYFIKREPRGEVTVAYKIKDSDLDIELDLTELDKHRLIRIVILNEQESTSIDRFFDDYEVAVEWLQKRTNNRL